MDDVTDGITGGGRAPPPIIVIIVVLASAALGSGASSSAAAVGAVSADRRPISRRVVSAVRVASAADTGVADAAAGRTAAPSGPSAPRGPGSMVWVWVWVWVTWGEAERAQVGGRFLRVRRTVHCPMPLSGMDRWSGGRWPLGGGWRRSFHGSSHESCSIAASYLQGIMTER